MSVYNEPIRVSRAIESILDQTFTDFEFIIVNDGSTDRTRDTMEIYRLRDSRIRVINQENAGLTRALISGCAAARGQYVARQDADDWSEPRRLAVQLAQLDADPTIGFVSCGTRFVGPNMEALQTISHSLEPAEATDKLLNECLGPPHGSVMFRRSLYEAVGGYRAEFYFGQDADLWLRMAEHSQIAYTSEVLYTNIRDFNTISARMGREQKKFGDLGQACRAARRNNQTEAPILHDAAQLSERIRATRHRVVHSTATSDMAYLIGASLLKQGDFSGRQYLRHAVKLNPLNWRAWVKLLTPPSAWNRRKDNIRSSIDTTASPGG